MNPYFYPYPHNTRHHTLSTCKSPDQTPCHFGILRDCLGMYGWYGLIRSLYHPQGCLKLRVFMFACFVAPLATLLCLKGNMHIWVTCENCCLFAKQGGHINLSINDSSNFVSCICFNPIICSNPEKSPHGSHQRINGVSENSMNCIIENKKVPPEPAGQLSIIDP